MARPVRRILWQIFIHDPIPADAEGAAPHHDLWGDFWQVFLAETGIAEVGIEIGDGQDYPRTVVRPVGEVVLDQGTDDFERHLFG